MKNDTFANQCTSNNQVKATHHHSTPALYTYYAVGIENQIGKSLLTDCTDIEQSLANTDYICWYLGIFNSPPLFFLMRSYNTPLSCFFNQKSEEVSWGFRECNQRLCNAIPSFVWYAEILTDLQKSERESSFKLEWCSFGATLHKLQYMVLQKKNNPKLVTWLNSHWECHHRPLMRK